MNTLQGKPLSRRTLVTLLVIGLALTTVMPAIAIAVTVAMPTLAPQAAEVVAWDPELPPLPPPPPAPCGFSWGG